MTDIETTRHPDKPHTHQVHMDGEHIANIEHRLRPVMGGGQSTFQPVWDVHAPDHKPDHFDSITATSLDKAKRSALLLSLHGDMKALKLR